LLMRAESQSLFENNMTVYIVNIYKLSLGEKKNYVFYN